MLLRVRGANRKGKGIGMGVGKDVPLSVVADLEQCEVLLNALAQRINWYSSARPPWPHWTIESIQSWRDRKRAVQLSGFLAWLETC